LWISIRDLNGDEFYFGAGGIELLAKLEGFFSKNFQGVSMDAILADDQRNLRAIELSLAPLLETVSAPPD
jgi:hypothetical protein